MVAKCTSAQIQVTSDACVSVNLSKKVRRASYINQEVICSITGHGECGKTKTVGIARLICQDVIDLSKVKRFL